MTAATPVGASGAVARPLLMLRASSPPITRSERRWWPLTDLSFLVVAVTLWLTLPTQRQFEPLASALVVGGMFAALLVRVPDMIEGSAVGTQAFTVCAFFVLPLNSVPLVIAAVCAVDAALRALRNRRLGKAALVLGDCWFTIPPALVLAAGPPQFDWSYWPLYATAFAAGIAADVVASSVRAGLSQDRFPPPALTWTVAPLDALLTPIGLLAAAQFTRHPVAPTVALICLPGLLAMVSRERRARIHEHQLALHDPLTGLANRRLFEATLAHAFAQACRDQAPRALALIDLDGFKAINDNAGHAAGDDALRLVAQRLRGLLRDADVLARLGGDEFAVLLAGPQDDAGCAAVARKIRAGLTCSIESSGRRFSVSGSVGCVLLDAGTSSQETLLGAADAAMYADKRARRAAARYS